MTNILRLDLKNVPNRKFNELKDWLKDTIGIEWDEIKRHGFFKRNDNDQVQCMFLIFKHEDAFQRATNKTPAYYLNEQGNDFGIRRDNEKDALGRELVIQTPTNVTIQNVVDRYGINLVTKCFQLNKQDEKARAESSLKLNNLPLTTDKTFLLDCLEMYDGPKPKRIHVGCTKNGASGWAKITFHDEEQRNEAAAMYEAQLCQNIFPITIQTKRGLLRQKFVRTTLEKDDKRQSSAKNFFRITIINREETLRIFNSQPRTHMYWTTATSAFQPVDMAGWTVDSSATVTVFRTDLYPDFEQIVDEICRKFSVEVQYKNLPNYGKRFTFNHGNPQKTSLAASMLAQNFAPMNIKLITDRQKQLFNELEETGELQSWATELCLAINKNQYDTNIEIRGPQIAQGQLMRRIADYSDEFNKRFREYELNATLTAFFGRQKAASVKLEEIASRWSSKSCSVSFISKTSTIIIIGKPNVLSEDIDNCEKEVVQLLNELTATTNDDESEEEEEDGDDDQEAVQQGRHCVFCKQKSSISTNLFHICGHAYCRCAAQSLNASTTFPFQCKDCQSNIHIRDIQIIFNNDEELFMRLLKNSIQNYLTTNAQQDDRIFCPNYECDGLIKLDQGYQTCLICGQSVCSKCQIINDELHVGRTCTQFLEAKKPENFLPRLFTAAKRFVEDNWPVDAQMQPIGRADENPYLEKRYKSLTRFYQGIKILGHSFPPNFTKGFFAYHGCSFQAITAICQDGFDPKRRTAQAYGRGEYFGVTANISHGYSQKGGSQQGFSQMIIAYLLRCPQLTTKENFCHVVDNPIDWKYAFNLPVLVITYGQMSKNQPSLFPYVIPDYVDDDDKSSWEAPFRWHWYQDHSQFEPYDDTINRMLEESYEQWKLHRGPPIVRIQSLTHYLDGTLQTYQIDYRNNQQTNMTTFHQRAITRRLMDKSSDNRNWFYRDEHENWVQYESLIQNSIEKAFQLYRLGQGSSTIDIRFPNRSETYQINFLLGQQINKIIYTTKSIKYEQGLPEPIKVAKEIKFPQRLPDPVKVGKETTFFRGLLNKISNLFNT